MNSSSNTVVIADLSRCQGYANCVITDSSRFDLGDDGKVSILQQGVAAEELPLAEEAVKSCPALALRLESEPT
ncbi:ferredoxin [Glutamicibacter sp.]|uniref:ferredoxin n=1 Tax=Glutamicibacter sp. TaxID=1931995 RepID=UPI003D6C4EFE